MAFKFPDKDPDEKLDYTVDWSRFIVGNQTIKAIGVSSATTWKIQKLDGSYVEIGADQSFQGDAVVTNVDAGESATTGLTIVSESITTASHTCTVVLTKGIANTTYRLLCQVELENANGLITSREINLRVRERS
tara:strand:+ start:322 stop:723 length:402 start_codon:yes stop_codon:yes gene_type:complete